MLKRLGLYDFKNFRKSELRLGPMTVLIGSNASGKSNVRDAFRFLHGISRGYTLAETLGEKWVEGGVLQWRGIRGGMREVALSGQPSFGLEVSLDVVHGRTAREATYRIDVDVSDLSRGPKVLRERLMVTGVKDAVFDWHQTEGTPGNGTGEARANGDRSHHLVSDSQPLLSRFVDHSNASATMRDYARQTLAALNAMQFLDLEPDAMRIPSFPGQNILGDRGENLSSVVQAIARDRSNRQALIGWIRELTPMDARGFRFVADQTGRVLLSLTEPRGRSTSAYSASDGTLRFLAVAAALHGPEPAELYFLEELENGIHPSRLYLLLQLIEQRVARQDVQVVATTHSPLVLALLSRSAREVASLVYRLPGRRYAEIKRVVDVEMMADLVGREDVARLLASGWFEDAVAFLSTRADDETEKPA